MESRNWRQRKDRGNLNFDELIDAVERLEKLLIDQAAFIDKLIKSNRFDKPFFWIDTRRKETQTTPWPGVWSQTQ
jgi:hypothetical protein